MRPLAIAVLAGSLALALPRVALASPPDDIEIALRAGVMTRPGGQQGSPLAFGLGVRAGAMIEGFYVGASVINDWGGSQSLGTPPGSGPGAPTSTGSLGTEYLLYGVDLGYSFTLFNRLVLRPQVGGGLDAATYTCSMLDSSGRSTGCAGQKTHGWYVEPGAVALGPLGRFLFAGLDANLLVIAPGDVTVSPAFTAHALLGLRF
jgi:hypothetical protein